jgi:hypothetical protein
LVAEIATGKVPAEVGTPEMTPVLLFNVRPVGNPEAPYALGEFAPVIV